MAIYIRRKRIIPASLAILLALAALPFVAMAQDTVNFYSTRVATGTENYSVLPNASTVPMPQPVRMIAACSYNSAAPEVVMVFDASALPPNGTVPKLQLALPAASSISAPACGVFPLPAGGVSFYAGVVIAASTKGKTLTTDTTSGGNTFFEVAY